MHHTKADVERLYIPRNKGRRGMIQLELSYKHQLLVNKNTLQQQQIQTKTKHTPNGTKTSTNQARDIKKTV